MENNKRKLQQEHVSLLYEVMNKYKSKLTKDDIKVLEQVAYSHWFKEKGSLYLVKLLKLMQENDLKEHKLKAAIEYLKTWGYSSLYEGYGKLLEKINNREDKLYKLLSGIYNNLLVKEGLWLMETYKSYLTAQFKKMPENLKYKYAVKLSHGNYEVIGAFNDVVEFIDECLNYLSDEFAQIVVNGDY